LNYYRSEIKKNGKTEELAELKKLFPSVTVSGEFVRRANTALIQHSGYIALDFDNIPDHHLIEVKTKIEKLDFVYYVGLSISGTGFYVIIPIPKHENDAEHKKSYYALEKYFHEIFGLKMPNDRSCKDVARLRIYSKDENAYLNENASTFTGLEEKSVFEKESPKPKKLPLPTHLDAYIQGAVRNILEQTDSKIQKASEGEKATVLFNQSVLIGGYIATGIFTEFEAQNHLENSISSRNIKSISQARQIIQNGIKKGIEKPISIQKPEPQIQTKPTPKAQSVKSTLNPPTNDHVEKSFLCLMLKKSLALCNVNNYTSTVFLNEQNKIIAETIERVFLDAKPVSYDAVKFELQNTNNQLVIQKLDLIIDYIKDKNILENDEKFSLLYFKQLEDIFKRTNLANLAQNVLEKEGSGAELLEFATNEILTISSQINSSQIVQVDETYTAYVKDLKLGSSGLKGISTGYSIQDNLTLGWHTTDLNILAARPAMGKSAAMISYCRNLAVQNIPTAVFSLEMSNNQLMQRFVSNHCQIDSYKLQSRKLSDYDFQQIDQAKELFLDAPLFLNDSASITILDIHSQLRRLKVQHDIKVAFVDYIGLVSATGRSRQEEIAFIARSLKNIAKELDICVIALSQLSRSVETRGGSHIPKLSDLRESGEIEQAANNVIFLYRPEYYGLTEDEDGNPTEGMAQLIYAKHREGALKTLNFQFKGEFAQFSEYDSDSFGEDYEPPF
jgi:replicative DNA helicase